MAQDRLKTMPGYQRHEKIAPQIAGSVVLGILRVNWTNDGNAFEYQREGKHYRYDVLSRTRTELRVLTNAASTATRGPSVGGRACETAIQRLPRSWPAIRLGGFAGRQVQGDLPRPECLAG